MNCAWDAYLNLVPPWLRTFVDEHGREKLQELRLRIGSRPELILDTRSMWCDRQITKEDITYSINAASQYSPWSATTSAKGYITAIGGHRVGVCGQVVVRDGHTQTISKPYQLCLRVARDFQGIARNIAKLDGSILLIGPPGSGKSTLLRDLIRCISNQDTGSVAVVDERGELFPFVRDVSCFDTGKRTDVLIGCGKPAGIEMVLRTMGPAVIAVDEITAEEDCRALIYAGWCGVRLLATAHALSSDDLFRRPVYKPLVQHQLFDNIIVLQKDKSWGLERMGQCLQNC